MKYFKLVIGLALGSIIGSATTLRAQHNCASSKQKSSLVALNKANATPVQMEMMEKFDITFHHLNLSIERDSKLIQGHVRTIAKLRTLTADTFGFQLHSNFLIDSIVDVRTLTKISFTRVQDFCYVPLLGNSAINEVVDIKIFYKGTAPTSGSAAIGDGFSNRASPSYGNQISWSLSQPYSAYEWWPCKQSLQDKIDSVFTSIKTDTSNKVGACGLLNEIENNGQGKHTFHWKSFLPIDYYLIMVSVGKYTEYKSYAKPKGINDSILVQHYIYNNPLAYSQNLTSINSTVPLIEKFSELFGVYPFHQEKYGHVMAPFSGGMEHQTMTTLGIFNFGIVAHELGHQWFGDHVTCKTWKDIWLNEGMATYLEYIAAKYLKTPAVAENELLVMHAEAKKGTGSVYCYDTTNVSRIFSSAITYNKGGSVVRVLHYLLGDSLFFDVLKNYQQRFAFKTASTADFNSLVNEIAGRNYDYFFNTWIYKNGWPTYNLKWNQIDSGLYLQFTQENFEDPSNLFDLYLPIKVNFKNGLDTMIYVRQKDASSSYMVKMNQTISSINLDPENWILKNATIKYDATINSLPVNWGDLPVSIYPNPCKDKLFLDNLPLGNIHYSLYDNNGRLMEAKKLNDNSTIDLSNIEVGAYFLTLSLNEKPLLGRFIVISR